MTVIVQQSTDSNGNPQPMVYDSDTGKIIVDHDGYVINGGTRQVNVPTISDYVNTPKTQTSGIQEAINYVSENNIVKITVRSGLYNITSDFISSAAGGYGQIVLPYIDSTGTTVANPILIEIEGEFSQWGSALGNPNGTPPLNAGTILYFNPKKTPPSDASAGEYAGIQGGWVDDASTNGNYVILTLKNITLRQSPNPSFTNLSLNLLANYTLEHIRNDTTTAINSNGDVTMPTNLNGIALYDEFPLGANRIGRVINDFYVEVYAVGVWLSYVSGVQISNLKFFYVVKPMLINSNKRGAALTVFGFTAYLCTYAILPNTNNVYLTVFGYYSNILSSGYDIDFQTNTDAIINIYGSTEASSAPTYTKTSTNDIIKYFTQNNIALTPTTPSVPSSGTAQANTNPYSIDAYIYGGTVTEIQITRNGTAYTVFSNSTGLALSGQSYKLNPGDSITVTYTAAPDWEWLSD